MRELVGHRHPELTARGAGPIPGARRPGKLKSETLGSLFERRPKEVLRKAVLGMLPKNKLRAKMIKRLEVK
ncbi:MAG: hypothetical protein COY02_02770 [Parcubacteria group bacterium CG_4_10_14_0_2_um_filter_41_6]|nr:MAG: hypothetical protein COY02_02770 [Parcubacteria group bacterium CG_4_10_14_0_2_um_filter_41_6]